MNKTCVDFKTLHKFEQIRQQLPCNYFVFFSIRAQTKSEAKNNKMFMLFHKNIFQGKFSRSINTVTCEIWNADTRSAHTKRFFFLPVNPKYFQSYFLFGSFSTENEKTQSTTKKKIDAQLLYKN